MCYMLSQVHTYDIVDSRQNRRQIGDKVDCGLRRRFVESRLLLARLTLSTVSQSTLSPMLNMFNSVDFVESGWFLSPECWTSFGLCRQCIRDQSDMSRLSTESTVSNSTLSQVCTVCLALQTVYELLELLSQHCICSWLLSCSALLEHNLVRMSDTCWYWLETNDWRIMQFSALGSSEFNSFFDTSIQSKGFSQDWDWCKWWKKADFRPINHSVSETIKDEHMVTMEDL